MANGSNIEKWFQSKKLYYFSSLLALHGDQWMEHSTLIFKLFCGLFPRFSHHDKTKLQNFFNFNLNSMKTLFMWLDMLVFHYWWSYWSIMRCSWRRLGRVSVGIAVVWGPGRERPAARSRRERQGRALGQDPDHGPVSPAEQHRLAVQVRAPGRLLSRDDESGKNLVYNISKKLLLRVTV